MGPLLDHSMSPKEKNITVTCYDSINNVLFIHVSEFGLSLGGCLMDLSPCSGKQVSNYK